MVMEILLKFLYGHETAAYEDDKLTLWAQDFKIYRLFLDEYIVAQKYLVPSMCVQAKDTFHALLERLPKRLDQSDILCKLVHLIYVNRTDEATDFRKLVVAHFAETIQEVGEAEGFRALFTQVPDFAFDVTVVVMQHKDKAEKGAAGKVTPAKKRRLR